MIDVVKREEKRMDRSLKQWHNLTLSISPFSTAGGAGGMEKRTIRVICCSGILSNTRKTISQNNILVLNLYFKDGQGTKGRKFYIDSPELTK